MKISRFTSLFIPVILLSVYSIQANAQKAGLVKIGKLQWCTRNLSVSSFRNGDPITEARTADEWNNALSEGKPAWCYYDNDSSNNSLYGKLYNWFAVSDPRGLAPEGFRLPTDKDWLSLMSSILKTDEDHSLIGVQELENMASPLMNVSGWDSIVNTNANGFAALPGGYRMSGGCFGKGSIAYWWTTSSDDNMNVHYIINRHQDILRRTNFRKDGYSVRCVLEHKRNDYANMETINLGSGVGVHCMITDHNNTLWLGTNKGVAKLEKKNLTYYQLKDGLPSDAISCMAVDKDNNIWVGTENKGIARFDRKTWTAFEVKKNNMIYSIGVNSEGIVWVINYEGLLFFDGKKWEFAEGKESRFTGVGSRMTIDSRDIVWFVHDYFLGLSCYIGNKYIFEPNHAKATFWHTDCIFADRNNNIWVGTNLTKEGLVPEYSGAIEYNGLKFSRCLEGEDVKQIAQTSNGDMWMTSANGLYCNYEKYPLDNKYGNIATSADGNLWLSRSNEIMYLDLQNSFVDKVNNQLYNTSNIEGKTWMADNLKAEKFRNGDPIRYISTKEQWIEACENSIPAYCYYGFSKLNKDYCGAIYNYAAISDPRGLAPKGWHIPTAAEWVQVQIAHGSEEEAGISMKSEQNWRNDKNGTNELGFNALPVGLLFDSGDFSGFGEKTMWWSSEINTNFENSIYAFKIGFIDDKASMLLIPRQAGAYVRCVKD